MLPGFLMFRAEKRREMSDMFAWMFCSPVSAYTLPLSDQRARHIVTFGRLAVNSTATKFVTIVPYAHISQMTKRIEKGAVSILYDVRVRDDGDKSMLR